MAELRKTFFEIVAKQRDSQQVFRRPSVMRARRLGAQLLPIVEIAVAPTEPSQCDKVDLLVLVQVANDRRQLGPDGVVGVILQNGQHGIVAGV